MLMPPMNRVYWREARPPPFGPSSGLDAPPWPSVRRGRHFLDASPVEEISPWRVRYGRHFADSPKIASGPKTRHLEPATARDRWAR